MLLIAGGALKGCGTPVSSQYCVEMGPYCGRRSQPPRLFQNLVLLLALKYLRVERLKLQLPFAECYQ